MKKKTLAAASLLLALLMPLGITPLTVYADEGEGTTNAPAEVAQTDWYVSRSKTATELDDDDVSHVTLSLPNEQETLVSDVVFVLDKSSCKEEAIASADEMLTALQNQVTNNNAKIQIGVIVFGGDAKTSYPLQAFPTTDDTLKELKRLFVHSQLV